MEKDELEELREEEEEGGRIIDPTETSHRPPLSLYSGGLFHSYCRYGLFHLTCRCIATNCPTSLNLQSQSSLYSDGANLVVEEVTFPMFSFPSTPPPKRFGGEEEQEQQQEEQQEQQQQH